MSWVKTFVMMEVTAQIVNFKSVSGVAKLPEFAKVLHMCCVI